MAHSSTQAVLDPAAESTLPGGSHSQASVGHARQRWTTATALADLLGYSVVTVWEWLRTGRIKGAQIHTRHYTDTRQRNSGRGQWRIYEADVLELLAHMAQGRTIRSFGRGFWKGGKR